MTGSIDAGPKSLVGEPIVVELVRPGSEVGQSEYIHPLQGIEFVGTLDNVGEFGIVATLEDTGQRFYPWNSVLSLYRRE